MGRSVVRPLPPFTGKGCRLVDPGIAHEVRVLWDNGVTTTESCQGGPGHSFPEPTVCFTGDACEGLRALTVALQNGLPVFQLRQVWTVQDRLPYGPEWQLTFVKRNPGR
jgi:hypothetical protein